MRASLPVVAFLLAVLAALGGAAGCATGGGGVPTSRELSVAQFDDVPVPRGFSLDLAEGRSFSYAEGGSGPAPLRMGRLEYTGLGGIEDVLGFYAAEMPRPIHGWSPCDRSAEDRPSSLRFTRGGDVCLVTVRQEGAQLRIVVERNTGHAVGRE